MQLNILRRSSRRPSEWHEIARAAAYVLALDQRPSGFWPLPTSPIDLDLTYADKGSEEEKARLREGFGFESITISWFALTSLDALFSSFPTSSFHAALRRLNECRAGGAYGIRSDSAMKVGPRIHPSARHTAMAILILLFHQDQIAERQRVQLLAESASWLLGGAEKSIAYAREPLDDDRAITIAACIAALSCVQREFGRREVMPDLVAGSNEAIRQAHSDLYENFSDKMWRTRYPKLQIVDNCLVLQLLQVGFLNGGLGSIVPDSLTRLKAARERLLRGAVEDGWPEAFSKAAPSLSATISGLVVMDSVLQNDTFRMRADRFVTEQILKGKGYDLLSSWDWIMLARLAAMRTGPLNELNSHLILRQCNRIRDQAQRKFLMRASVLFIPKASREVVLFMHSKGEPQNIPVWRFKASVSVLPRWLVWLLGLFGTSSVLVLGDNLKHVFREYIGYVFHFLSNRVF